MRIAITGATGLFGHGLVQILKDGHDVYPISHQEMDVTNSGQVEAVVLKIRPEVVIHAAAIPNPDTCEEDPALAYAVNVHGTRHVCEAARAAGALVACISTDAVFRGQSRRPYQEGDPTGPLTVYGRTKLRAEELTQRAAEYWIFRVSVLFGPGKENFVSKGLAAIKAGKPCVAASDQMGNASFTLDLAGRIRDLIEAREYGLYHLANSGCCTRLELARNAAELAGLDPEGITGKTLEEMQRPARRLKYSVMAFHALERAGFPPLRPWQEALKEYLRG